MACGAGLNQDHRYHVARQKRRVTNPATGDAALCQRGSVTVWFADDTIEEWRAQPRTVLVCEDRTAVADSNARGLDERHVALDIHRGEAEGWARHDAAYLFGPAA